VVVELVVEEEDEEEEEEEEEEEALSALDGSFATESKRARLRAELLAAFGSFASLRVRDRLRGGILFVCFFFCERGRKPGGGAGETFRFFLKNGRLVHWRL